MCWLGDHEMGELLVRGPAVTRGYWSQPALTSETIDDDGWLRSCDIAVRDGDGYYRIVDRRKDMYISGGENVYPAEVEQVLLTHPAIAGAAVIGVSDVRWGEVGVAVVVPHQGHDVNLNNVASFCDGRLARYKIPKHLVRVPALPRNATGKVLKDELRQTLDL